MAERAREYEQDYFRKRGTNSMAQRLSEVPTNQIEEAASPAYDRADVRQTKAGEPQREIAVPQNKPMANPRETTVTKGKITKGEKSFIALISLLVLGLTILNLVVQYKDERIAVVTQEYQTKTTEIQYQTDELLNELAMKYDYQTIKEIAHENGMTLQNSQVRTVGE